MISKLFLLIYDKALFMQQRNFVYKLKNIHHPYLPVVKISPIFRGFRVERGMTTCFQTET